MTRKEYWDKQKALEMEYKASQHDAVKGKADKAVEEHEAVQSRYLLRSEDLLNPEDFERYIGVGTSKEDLMIIFLTDRVGMDHFCRKTYGVDFDTAYTFFLKEALANYKDVLRDLASVGNATAMNTLNQLVLNMSDQKDVRIKICGAIPTESKDDDK